MEDPPSFPLRHAIALGMVQGPTELLPVSSSGHTVLIPAMLDWPYPRLRPAHRKAFEVALHAGGATGLVATTLLRRGEGPIALPPLKSAHGGVRSIASSAAPTIATVLPAVAGGLFLGRRIEERLGGPRGVARAQVLAGAALAAADRLPARRRAADARLADAVLLGLGQAAALVPGVSRSGGVLATARLLGFRRADAAGLAWQAALPVLLGATGLQVVRLAREGLPGELRRPFAAGATAAFASTVAARPLAATRPSARWLATIAAYRVALGAGALLVLRRRARTAPAAARFGGA